jgi:hypothetical protein
MVSVELIGGMGNQMFQIAACIAYAKKHGLEYHIPVKTQNSHSSAPYFENYWNPDWDEKKESVYYDEPNFHYDEIPLINIDPNKQNLILRGYFQSYKYFEDWDFGGLFWSELSGIPYANRDQTLNIPHKKLNSVAVHVRKGDYELYPTKHPIVSVDYISSALNQFKEKGIDQVYFFSDNPDWCAQFAHMRKLSCSVIFEYDPIKSFLNLMSHDHFILSNSTFGYWAAMMNQWLWPASVGTVVYPGNWFGSDYAHLDTKDMCPPEWIKM